MNYKKRAEGPEAKRKTVLKEEKKAKFLKA